MPILRSTLSIRGLYNYDPTIFDNFHLPEDYDTDELRDMIVSSILAECGELEILYPDPDYMKGMIELWSVKNEPNWQRIFDVFLEEYDPIHNYYRHTTHNGGEDYTITDSVKGYNETSFVDSDRSQNYAHNNFTRDISGNIGNTSFSKLVEEEIELRKKYNPIDIVVQDFKQRFCILVY